MTQGPLTLLLFCLGDAGDHLRPVRQRVEQVWLLQAPRVPQRGGGQ